MEKPNQKYNKGMKSLKITCCLFVLLMMLSASATAQTEQVVGYCAEELPPNSVGLQGGELRISAAIHLPKSKMMRYKGGQLTKIRFAVKEGFENFSVWVRTSLNTSSKIVQSVEELQNGWNEVTLNRPYPIDGEDLYIGYTATQPDGFSGIIAGGTGNEYTSWIGVDNQWADYSEYGLGILYIQGIVEADVFDQDAAMVDLSLDKQTYTADETLHIDGMLVNTGTTNISGFQLNIVVDGGIGNAYVYDEVLQPEQTETFSHTLSLAGVGEGRHELIVSVVTNDDFDQNAANDELRVPFYVYSSTYPRTLLLEHFTSLPCVNCPPVDALLEEVTEQRGDVVWVSHHVGYRDDEFTLDASRNLTRFGVTGNPNIMIDRTLLDINETVAFPITSESAETVNELYFDRAAAVPSFLELSASGDAVGNVLSIHVEGEGKDYVAELYPNAMLHVFLVEDQVYTPKPQAGNSTKHIHDNITRAFVTSSRGIAPQWQDDGTFQWDTTFELTEQWRQQMLRVVAFITKAADRESGYPTGEVLNATQAYITTDRPTGIAAVSSAHARDTYYNIWGQRIDQPLQRHGVMIVRDGNAKSKKVIVR